MIELVKLIKFSQKRTTLFQTMKSQMSPNSCNLRPLCPTRWTVRNGAITAVLNNYSTLQSTLEEIHDTGRDEYAMKAGGFSRQLQMFTTFFGPRLCQSIFAPTEQLSCVLQGKDTTVQEAREAAITTEMYLRRQRTEASFDHFYDEVVTDSATLTDEPVLPRRHKLPKRINDGSSSHQFASPKDMFRQIYFEAFDVVSQEISNRFRQNDLEVVAEMEQLLLESANGQQYPISDKIKSLYSSDLNIDRLILHLNMLPDLIKRYSAVLGSEITSDHKCAHNM